MLIDSHVHLQDKKFARDLDRVLERASDAGIQRLICIGDRIDSSRKAVTLAGSHPHVNAVVGVHPNNVKDFTPRTLLELRSLIRQPGVVGVGEIGLDYHYPNFDAARQKEVFVAQAHLADSRGLPLVIHCRDAYDDLIEIIRNDDRIPRQGVIHCFSGDVEQGEAFVELGYYLGIGGAISYPNGDRLREVVRRIGLERMVSETDAPYLPPQAKRGRRNEPSYMKFTIKSLADLCEVKYQDAARVTKTNAIRLYNLPSDPVPAIAYPIRESLFLGITNECINNCIFCKKCADYMVMGHYLKLRTEPSVEELIDNIGDPLEFREIVLSGLGEPTFRWNVCLEVARILKDKGARVGLNTSGQGNIINRRDITPEMMGLFDSVCVNMMGHDEASYNAICNPGSSKYTWRTMLEFAEGCKAVTPEVVMSAIAVPDLDVDAARVIAEDEMGVRFRIREYRPAPSAKCAECDGECGCESE